MIKHGKFGANTKTGIVYESKADLSTFLAKQKNYSVKELAKYSGNGKRSKAYSVIYKNKEVAKIFKQHSLYNYLFKEYEIDWKSIISKKLLPDDSIFVFINNTFFIIEIKHQDGNGSVDEKIQTCDFKKKQYQKLLSNLNCKVEYWYLLDKWFNDDRYKDARDYIISVGCRYFFEYIPLKELGLPVPK